MSKLSIPIRTDLLPERAEDTDAPLRCLDRDFQEFIRKQFSPMTVKNARTRRYCLVNAAAASIYGLRAEAYNGFTFDDIAKLNGLDQTMVQNITKWDQQVCLEKKTVQFQQTLLTWEQFIRVETVIKQPILDEQRQIVGILDSSQNKTPFLDLHYLFSLYQQNHTTKQAIRYFLRYLELESYFYKLPTKRELATLLTLRKAVTAQQAAQHMGISSRTIEEYKARLHCKLKINLHDLLFKLRSCYEDPTLSAVSEF